MTKQQRNGLLIVGGIIVGSFVVRSYNNAYVQNERFIEVMHARHEAAAKAKAEMEAHNKRVAESQPTAPVHVGAPVGLAGKWRGSTAIKDKGICTLDLEITPEPDGQFTGDSTFGCANKGLMMANARATGDLMLDKAVPTATALTGTRDAEGTIAFHASKTFDNGNCVLRSISVSPFGKDRLAAQWQDCQGGYTLLQRIR